MKIESVYNIYPGKSGNNGNFLPLWMHLEDTASVMKFLCEHRVSDSVIFASGMTKNEFFRIAEFIARVHDIGKFTPYFLSKITLNLAWHINRLNDYGLIIPQLSEYASLKKIPHTLAGEMILRHLNYPDGICSVVGAHHGKPTESNTEFFGADPVGSHLQAYSFSYYASQKDVWSALQEKVLNTARKKSGYSLCENLPVLSNCAQMLLTGLLIQADWIASNQSYFPLYPNDEYLDSEDCRERSASALEKLKLPYLWYPEHITENLDVFFCNRFGYSPNAVQTEAVNVVKNSDNTGGLLIIEAQMGVGKTEAALAAAEILAEHAGCGGLFIGLPTQATSNGIFPRVAEWAEKITANGSHSIRLVHGNAELNEDYKSYLKGDSSIDDDECGLAVHSWFSGRKQALLADFVVGTVDTALMLALKQKHVMLRHLGLCGKVVIIDECHAYDAYMSKYLTCMLKWLGAYQVPVILLSATLPEEKKENMINAYRFPFNRNIEQQVLRQNNEKGYPLITWATRNEIIVRSVKSNEYNKTVKLDTVTDDDLINSLKEQLSAEGCIGVIVNTVKRAQKLASEMREIFFDKQVYLYHSQFLAQERENREKLLVKMIGKNSSFKQRNKVIVVGTQVLEQSLDIDFDYLVTDLCPMDLLLQRIGRLHRHRRVRPDAFQNPCCTVIIQRNGYEPGSRKIYGEWLLGRTLENLTKQIRIPNDIPLLVNKVYADPNGEDENNPEWIKYRDRIEISEEKADSWILKEPQNSRRIAMNSIVGLLDRYIENDKKAEASVRDGMNSIDVLVMFSKTKEYAGFLTHPENGLLRCDRVPSDEEAKEIAMQRLHLPFVFSLGNNASEVINELETENAKYLAPWQESVWLKGELIMLLDENGERNLGKYHLCYKKDNGLQYERLGDVNDGEKV